MLSLMKGVFGPSVPYQDKIMYMTAIGLNDTIGSEKNATNPICVEQIINLITSANTRYIGLQLLELALQQNPDYICNKAKWVVTSYNIIKDFHAASLEKEQACKILTLIIPYIDEDKDSEDIKDEIVKDIYPTLLQKIDENVEWALQACICVKMCLKTFPNRLAFYQGTLFNIILHQASYNVSSKFFELLAECFCELPHCSKEANAENVKVRWDELYFRTLKTLESLQINFLSYTNSKDPYERLDIDLEEFTFNDDNDDDNFFPAFVKRVRRFINLCKCLAKLLSVKSRYPVKPPVELTVKCLIPLYTCCRKEKLNSNEEVLYTFIAQLRLAGIAVLESLLLNCNLQQYAVLMNDMFKVILISTESIISSEIVSELRVAAWKLLSLWLNCSECLIARKIASASDIISELLKDINIDASESLQASNAMQTHNKSKKSTCSDSSNKSVLKRKNRQKVCEAALISLESLLCARALDFSKGVVQEICNRVFKICLTIYSPRDSIPFPYDDESCREKLYSLVLTIMAVLKPDECQILQTAGEILGHINKDPSFRVRKLKSKALVIQSLQLYPKRALPICSDNKQRHSNVCNEISKYTEWSSEEYEQSLKIENVPESPENVNTNADQSFQNENDMEGQTAEYMEVETHYSEQLVENRCNGEDMLDIQSSSQCQDDVESDDEEEEEDDERSYEDEEINQEEPLQEVYIPTSKKMQVSSTVQINSETVESITEPDYQELGPCIKAEENALNNSNKDNCINGESNVMCEEDMPSSSTQITNENGIFGVDDDDLDEENEDDDDDEENESYPADKRVESYDLPPSKKQKKEEKSCGNS